MYKKEFCIDPLMAICSRNICLFIIIIILVVAVQTSACLYTWMSMIIN